VNDNAKGSSRITRLVKRFGYGGASITRIDHSRMYICTNIGLISFAFSLLIVGPIPNTTLANTDFWSQQLLAACVIVGSSTCLLGTIRGTRLYKPDGDIRISYSIAKWGILSNAFSMVFYVISVMMNNGQFWASALTTSLGGMICVGMLWIGLDFEIETEKLDEKFRAEIEIMEKTDEE
jgi:hypothetical protein